MLEEIVVSEELSKEAYQTRLAALEPTLFHLEWKAREAKVPVIVLLEGLAASGVGEALQILTERLDPRSLRVYASTAPTEIERKLPWLHRFWLRLPNYGEMAIFDGSWYGQVLQERVHETEKGRELAARVHDITQLEEMLLDDGHVLIKLWFHVSRKEQGRRLKKADKDKHDFWEVGPHEWAQHDEYKHWRRAADELLQATHTARAPWVLLDGETPRLSRVRMFEVISRAIQDRLGIVAPTLSQEPSPAPATSSAALDRLEERADQIIKEERSPAP